MAKDAQFYFTVGFAAFNNAVVDSNYVTLAPTNLPLTGSRKSLNPNKDLYILPKEVVEEVNYFAKNLTLLDSNDANIIQATAGLIASLFEKKDYHFICGVTDIALAKKLYSLLLPLEFQFSIESKHGFSIFTIPTDFIFDKIKKLGLDFWINTKRP